MSNAVFLARLAKGDTLVIIRFVQSRTLSREELLQLEKFLRLRKDANVALKTVEQALRRMEKEAGNAPQS